MPYLHLHSVKGLLSPQQKRELKERCTDLLGEVEGGGDPAFRNLVWIRIEDEDAENWSLGMLRPSAETIARTAQAREARRAAGGQV